MYLAGYSVECVLKTLILSASSAGDRAETLTSCRGVGAHDYEWLKSLYRPTAARPSREEVVKNFVRVNAWTTELRYKTGTTKPRSTEDFFEASRAILEWAGVRF